MKTYQSVIHASVGGVYVYVYVWFLNQPKTKAPTTPYSRDLALTSPPCTLHTPTDACITGW